MIKRKGWSVSSLALFEQHSLCDYSNCDQCSESHKCPYAGSSHFRMHIFNN